MWHEGRLRQAAARQHGLIGRDQARSLGATDHEISRHIESGRLEVVHPGVYYLNCTPATWKTEVLAAAIAAGPDALASHRCAAVLWGMDSIYGRMIEVTVPYSESPVPKGAILHRTRRHNPRFELDSIPISPPEKTLLDMAGTLPERTLWKAARSAVKKGISSVEKMDVTVGVYGGRGVGGTKRMRRVIRLVADDESGSVAEIDLAWIVMNAPVPEPIQQLRIRLPNGNNAYPDFSWPDRMRIVEVDGFGAHGAPEQMKHDLQRQNQLLDLGWEIRPLHGHRSQGRTGKSTCRCRPVHHEAIL